MSVFQDFVARLRRAFRAFESDRTESRSSWTLRAVVQPAELDGGWIAECIDLPGAMSQGETEQEAIENLKIVVVDIIEYRMGTQLPVEAPDVADRSGSARREFALTV